ncbi:hypothetical protein [Deinococcus altitudinis]|uniref:hypothetical protein n=1 Tax=Deinococcus altitudinis TaxID=468914 RepID=UPI003892B46C
MRFQTDVFHLDTEDFAADLRQWESKKAAILACVAHAGEPLTWHEPWSGTWNARSQVYWYRITRNFD